MLHAPILLAHGGSAGDALPLPTSVSEYLGAFDWSWPVLVSLGLTAAVYLAGVVTLRRRGDRWPVGRTISFLVPGLGSLAVALVWCLGAYDDTLFSAHMAQHMILTMVGPVFLALGAPITLALRSLPAAPRHWLLTVLHSRVAAVLTFPLVGWLVFVGTPFALYYSGWYPATLSNGTLHNLTHVHFVIGALLFFVPLIGIDPLSHRASYPVRLLILFSVLPFHAFLGISVMSDKTLIAASHYLAIPGQTYAGAMADQGFGGGLLWSSGDLLGLIFLMALVTQWMRADEREALRTDRRLDRAELLTAAGHRQASSGAAARDSQQDEELAAYNARLAALHRRTPAG